MHCNKFFKSFFSECTLLTWFSLSLSLLHYFLNSAVLDWMLGVVNMQMRKLLMRRTQLFLSLMWNALAWVSEWRMPQVRFFVLLGVYTDIYGQKKFIEYLSMIQCTCWHFLEVSRLSCEMGVLPNHCPLCRPLCALDLDACSHRDSLKLNQANPHKLFAALSGDTITFWTNCHTSVGVFPLLLKIWQKIKVQFCNMVCLKFWQIIKYLSTPAVGSWCS
jgi:hypothetical protein